MKCLKLSRKLCSSCRQLLCSSHRELAAPLHPKSTSKITGEYHISSWVEARECRVSNWLPQVYSATAKANWALFYSSTQPTVVQSSNRLYLSIDSRLLDDCNRSVRFGIFFTFYFHMRAAVSYLFFKHTNEGASQSCLLWW